MRLFQLKEWRLDRLKEHLRTEGVRTSLLGTLRPLIVLAVVLAAIALPVRTALPAAGLTLLALLAAVQLGMKKQPLPVWTQKAILIAAAAAALSLIATILLASSTQSSAVLALWVLLQPLPVLAAWAALLPLDRLLKRRVFTAAGALRAADSRRPVIGIVGSVGKTTTKELLGHLLQDVHPIVTPEHVNTEMGVAQWLLGQRTALRERPAAPLVIEMGAYARGEIALLCSFVRPTIGIVTALGSDHLGLFGSEEAIVDANGELVEALPSDGRLFCHIDTEGGRALVRRAPCPVTRVGTSIDADIRAVRVADTEEGLTFSAGEREYRTTLRGVHHAGNVLLATEAARFLGVRDERIQTLLASFRPHAHTFRVQQEAGVTLVDDTYNASPLSMRAALAWAAERSERPRVLLTSGLLELGKDGPRILEEMGHFAQGKVERVLFPIQSGRSHFQRGFGQPVETLTPSAAPVPPGGLLLCVGRMPLAGIQRLLPRR